MRNTHRGHLLRRALETVTSGMLIVALSTIAVEIPQLPAAHEASSSMGRTSAHVKAVSFLGKLDGARVPRSSVSTIDTRLAANTSSEPRTSRSPAPATTVAEDAASSPPDELAPLRDSVELGAKSISADTFEVVSGPTISFGGTVYAGSTSDPVGAGDASVTWSDRNDNGIDLSGTVETGSDGSYVISGLPASGYLLVYFDYVGPGTFSSQYLDGTPYGGNPAYRMLGTSSYLSANVNLSAPVTVSGYVLLMSGYLPVEAPAGSVQVQYSVIGPQGWGPLVDGPTVGAGGDFSLSVVSGYYRFYFDYLGSSPNEGVYYGGYDAVSSATSLEVQATDLSISQVLPEEPTLYGTVTVGVVPAPATADEATVSVQYLDDVSNTWLSAGSAQTEANGSYSVPDMPVAGQYRADITYNGAPNTYVNIVDETISGVSNYADPYLLQPTNFNLDTSVTETEQVTLGGTGEPASAGQVTGSLYPGGQTTIGLQPFATATTDANGNLVFSNLRAGSMIQLQLHFNGTADYPDYFVPADASCYGADECSFETGIADASIDCVLPLENVISGNVVSDAGKPLAGITVIADLLGSEPGEYTDSIDAITDSSGNYSLTGLPAGGYNLMFQSQSGTYADEWFDNTSDYYVPETINTLSAGGQISGVDADMHLSAAVHGSLSLPSGADEWVESGHVSVDVEVLDGPTQTWVDTGYGAAALFVSSGHYTYSIGGLAPDNYRLLLVYNSSTAFGTSQSAVVTINPGQSVALNLGVSVGIPLSSVQPGMLIRSDSAGSTSVYLVDGDDLGDGDDDMVPVTALDYASSMGISTTISSVDSAIIAAGPITAPLTTIVFCSGQYYVGGSGKLWPIASNLVAALPSTTLQQATCDVIPTSSASITTALFVKSSASPTIWYVDAAGQKVAMTSTTEMTALNGGEVPITLTVASEFISGLAAGPNITYPGELIETASSSAMYLADGTDRLIPVPSLDYITALGLTISPVVVTNATITSEAVAGSPLSSIVSCSGSDYIAGSGELWALSAVLVGSLPVTTLEPSTCAVIAQGPVRINNALLVRSETSPTTWYVDPNGLRHIITSVSAITALRRGDSPTVLTVPAAFIASLTEGAPILSPASLVDVAGVTYLVDGASNLVPVSSPDTVSEMGLPTSATVVSAASVSGWTIATSRLSSVVSCSGEDYIGGSGKLWPIAPSLVGVLPVTTLTPATCAAIPTATAKISRALFVKSTTSSTVWQIDLDGRRDAVDSPSILQADGSAGAPEYLLVPQELIQSLPVGPDVVTAGTLVRSASTGQEYLADGSGGFVPVPDPSVLADAGLATIAITVSATTISHVGQPLTNVLACGGSDYLAGSGQFWQLSGAAAGSLGTPIPATLCAALVHHSQTLDSGVVRGETSGSFFTLVGGQKVPLAGGASGAFANVNDGWLASVPSGS